MQSNSFKIWLFDNYDYLNLKESILCIKSIIFIFNYLSISKITSIFELKILNLDQTIEQIFVLTFFVLSLINLSVNFSHIAKN